MHDDDRRTRWTPGRGSDAAARHRCDVHPERRAHLAAVRRGPCARDAGDRHPPRADGDVCCRGLRQAHPQPGLRCAHRGSGHHQRCVGHHQCVVQRFTGRGDGGSCTRGSVGRRLVAGDGPCAGGAEHHQERPHRERRHPGRCAGARGGHAEPHPAPRAHVPRLPARRVRPVERRGAGGRRVHGHRPSTRPGRGEPPGGSHRRRRAPGVHRGQRRVLGRRVGRTARRGRAPARALFLQRPRSRHAAGPARAGLPAYSWVAEAAGRSGGGARYPARLPSRLRTVRKRAGGPRGRQRGPARRAHRRAHRGG